MTLADRDRAVVWHPYTQMLTRPDPLPIVRGEGVYLFTEDGKRLLDGTSSWWVNIHGHAHPRLSEAVAEQARTLEHVVFANCTHEPAVTLAERLVRVLPKGLTRVFYSDNGSTAVEVAMKLALQVLAPARQAGAAEVRHAAPRLSRRHRGSHVRERGVSFHAALFRDALRRRPR